ncbi:MAG TPA: pH regulation protein F [Actinobacteria bacterium]|nr:pH regulation protein F [Actinomycetota bacterium]
MQTFFLAVGLILLVNAFVCLFRAIAGPTLPDRIVAVNIVGTKTTVILVLIAYIFAQHMYIDTAFVYALLNFVVTVAVARYLETGGLPSA